MRNKYERALIYIGETIVWKLHEHAPKNAIIHDCFPEQFELLKELVDKAPYYKDLEDKATPKKPIILGPEDFALFECPTCHDKTHCGDFSHCSECGQKLDWREDD